MIQTPTPLTVEALEWLQQQLYSVRPLEIVYAIDSPRTSSAIFVVSAERGFEYVIVKHNVITHYSANLYGCAERALLAALQGALDPKRAEEWPAVADYPRAQA